MHAFDTGVRLTEQVDEAISRRRGAVRCTGGDRTGTTIPVDGERAHP
jgi:hypothetical protein